MMHWCNDREIHHLSGPVLPPIDPDKFRLAMRGRASGVTIITSRAGAVIHGMTATSVSTVCLDPPLLLVCVDKRARTHALIEASGIFAFNFLHQEQRELADRFAGHCDGDDRFCNVAFHQAITGAPILDSSLGYCDCTVFAGYDGGDHTIFVGQVQAAYRVNMRGNLIYYDGNYFHFPISDRSYAVDPM